MADKEAKDATPLDPDERQGLKLKHITTRDELNQVEQANIQEGLAWLKNRRNHDVLTEDFTRRFHRQLFGGVWNWAGTYRQSEKNIGIDPVHIPVQLHVLLDDARYWAENDAFPPLEAAARFHHRLVQIHCFPNGNGRHARIMVDEYLNKFFNHPPINWAAGHDLMNSNERRDAYISALRSADAGNYGKLLSFVGAR